MNLSLLNSLCYTFGWFWCVLFGIHGHSILALIGAVVLILAQLYFAKAKNISLYIQDVLLLIFSIPLGFLMETFFIQTNLIHYSNSNNILPPIWIICLYPLFSLLLNHSLRLIKKNYLISFMAGFIAPLSYLAGVSLGGLTFGYPLFQAWIFIGISWGLFFCLLTKLANIIEKATNETLSERDSNNRLKLLYDGECPLCKREICALKMNADQSKMKFIDIASKDFLQPEHGNIDYKTAMSQIHAIDSKGNLLIGIPAFAAVYARCQLLVLSAFLRIPFVESALKPFYRLFAKNRLWITGRNDADHTK